MRVGGRATPKKPARGLGVTLSPVRHSLYSRSLGQSIDCIIGD